MPTRSLYIHIPFCSGKCPYCGFYSIPADTFDTDIYIDALIKEADRPDMENNDIETIYIGGGTPTILPEKNLCKLLEFLCARFPGAGEYTIETNPSPCCRPDWKKLASYGINRVSIGVQSMTDSELDMLGRGYSSKDILPYIEKILDCGITNVGIDLIFALPRSTMKSWQYTLEQALKLPVKHISAYSLSFDEGTRFTSMLKAGQMQRIDEETDRQMYLYAIEAIEAAGFNHYEISNFARPSFKCAHNMTYWNNRGYIGLGAAAGSFHNRLRSENIADVSRYVAAINNDQSPKEYKTPINGKAYACETAVLMLRTIEGVDIESFKLQTGFDLLETFSREIERNINDRMLEIRDGRLRLTANALPIADQIICDFA